MASRRGRGGTRRRSWLRRAADTTGDTPIHTGGAVGADGGAATAPLASTSDTRGTAEDAMLLDQVLRSAAAARAAQPLPEG
ncbi:MAG TPA: hypothetical protein VHD39_04660 [Acidimicrobiales bacterium]|nr:hypothetical protein [Acidimicrobiales bacterium]